MEREEKGRAREGKKQEEFMGIKLQRGILVGKRGGTCTTPSPTWKFGSVQPHECSRTEQQDLVFQTNDTTTTTTLSARKLGANLWEALPLLTAAKMSKVGGARFPHRRRRNQKDKGFQLPTQLDEEIPGKPHEEPESDSSLRRHVAASLIQYHRAIERNGHALQPVSPASYSSSMEVAPYNPAITPSSSVEFKGRLGESTFNLKTSTELLKVLNRIWSLEEQHASNISLVNAMKRELEHCHARNKELLREKKRTQQEMDELMKQVTADKIGRKNKEQDRIKAAVQSVRDELDDERKLRKHSESLHRKLAREISELKSSFSSALKDLEREKKARILLEDLCDEFAKGIRGYEQEVRFLKHKPEKDRAHRESPDRLILHLSEAWLDERMQMNLAEPQYDLAKKNTIVDKLSLEIETFLRARNSVGSINMNDLSISHKKPMESSLRMHSSESFHLNAAGSAPHNADEEEDSTSSDSNCFELTRVSSGKQNINGSSKQNGNDVSESHTREKVRSNSTKKKVQSREIGSENLVELTDSQKFEISEGAKVLEDIKKRSTGNPGLNGNHMFSNLARNHSLSLQGGKLHAEKNGTEDSRGQSALPGHASPVQPWVSRFTTPDIEVSETSSRWPQSLGENTLKAKLLEARLEGQRSHSKPTKSSS
ncbi:hypothetical protein RHMOL_Rhmol07G0010900 [Rhododendron molle]|uniref:Uncharacterized protein n=1 Tax=Rhododendron molle TaxID=49168 RepID=A0ACC0MVU3_RHOML|nr:hypothetical protein RHMOL_Rhmol07G0010900 [Rhododendron molle]